VADEAVDPMLAFLKTDGTVDRCLADQLLPPLSMIKGESHFKTDVITEHLLTNAYFIRSFLDVDILIEGEVHQPGKVRVVACGLVRTGWCKI